MRKAINKEMFVLIVLLIITTLFVSPYLRDVKKVLVEESILQFYSYAELNRQSILSFKKIPFWSPYFGGGYPFYRHPSNMMLSPLFYLFILPFGVVCGTKLIVLLSYYIGSIGIYLLMRKHFKFNLMGSFFASAIFILNSYMPYQLSTGGLPHQYLLYVPLVLFFFLRAHDNKKYLFYCLFLLILLFFSGIGLKLAPLLLFLILYSIISLLVYKKKYLKIFIIIVTLFLCLSAIKLIPMLNLIHRTNEGENLYRIGLFNCYRTADMFTHSWDTLYKALFNAGPYLSDQEKITGLSDGLGVSSVMYFGFIPIIISSLGFVFCFKRLKVYLLFLAIYIALSMGSHFPINILRLICYFPVYNTIYYPAKYYSFFVVLLISLAAGGFFTFLNTVKYKYTYVLKIFLFCICFLSILDMFIKNISYFTRLSEVKYDISTVPGRKDFFQIKLLDKETDSALFSKYNPGLNIPDADSMRVEEIGDGMQYFLLMQNIGRIDWFGDLYMPEYAKPKYYASLYYGDYWRDSTDMSRGNGIIKNPNYMGEAYIEGSSERLNFNLINTDTFEISGNIDQPSTIIINQNYDSFWHSNIGHVENNNGLLSVRLNSSDSVSKHRVIKLTYFPKDFLYGGIISFLSLLMICIFYQKEHPKDIKK